MKLITGTRGSTLALRQVEIVETLLMEHGSDIEIEIKIITTSGDRFRDRPIEAINQQGVFTKAIDEALLNGDVDFAVHSMKDLPMEIPEGIIIIAVPERASPRDVLVSEKYGCIADLPEGAVIGTASPRRKAQILHQKKHLEIKLIRGNVDTRLGKLFDGEYDAIILAESGLDRLHKSYVISERLSLEDFTPSACQGALAISTRDDNVDSIKELEKITHLDSWKATMAERAFITMFGGGCKTPIGVYVEVKDELELFSSILAPNGSVRLQFTASGSPDDPEGFGRKAALDMMGQGAAKLIERWSK